MPKSDTELTSTEIVNVIKGESHPYVLYVNGIINDYQLYDLTEDELRELNACGRSDEIIRKILRKKAEPYYFYTGVTSVDSIEAYTCDFENNGLEPFEFYDYVNIADIETTRKYIPSPVGNWILVSTFKYAGMVEFGIRTWDHLNIHDLVCEIECIFGTSYLSMVKYKNYGEMIGNINDVERHESYEDEEVTYRILQVDR